MGFSSIKRIIVIAPDISFLVGRPTFCIIFCGKISTGQFGFKIAVFIKYLICFIIIYLGRYGFAIGQSGIVFSYFYVVLSCCIWHSCKIFRCIFADEQLIPIYIDGIINYHSLIVLCSCYVIRIVCYAILYLCF